jgi:hypothetical protein
VRSTSPDETTVHVFGVVDAELDGEVALEEELLGEISVKMNDLPSAPGVRQPVTICGAEDEVAGCAAEGSVDGV